MHHQPVDAHAEDSVGSDLERKRVVFPSVERPACKSFGIDVAEAKFARKLRHYEDTVASPVRRLGPEFATNDEVIILGNHLFRIKRLSIWLDEKSHARSLSHEFCHITIIVLCKQILNGLLPVILELLAPLRTFYLFAGQDCKPRS